MQSIFLLNRIYQIQKVKSKTVHNAIYHNDGCHHSWRLKNHRSNTSILLYLPAFGTYVAGSRCHTDCRLRLQIQSTTGIKDLSDTSTGILQQTLLRGMSYTDIRAETELGHNEDSWTWENVAALKFCGLRVLHNNWKCWSLSKKNETMMGTIMICWPWRQICLPRWSQMDSACVYKKVKHRNLRKTRGKRSFRNKCGGTKFTLSFHVADEGNQARSKKSIKKVWNRKLNL